MKSIRVTKQVIVVFLAMFAGFTLVLPDFLTQNNIVALLQNVAILGILGLGMALIVTGRGIDLSMVAILAVPPGLVLQLVQNGPSVPAACTAQRSLVLIFELVNGWLIAYAEVPPATEATEEKIMYAAIH